MPENTKQDPAAGTPEEKRPVVFRPIDPVALDKLLDEWMQGDADEQRETFEALRKGLDEDRPEGYKLFP